MDTVCVKDLFYESKENLPEFVNKKNVVYLCRNSVNGKVYVGETNNTLYKRWVGNNYFTHQYNYEHEKNRIIYNAFRKYGVENFQLSIIEEGFEYEAQRKESEKKWIAFFHSYVGDPQCMGYNMTEGADDNHFIHSKESRQKAMESNRKHHGGILAFQSEESREKARQTQYERYGMLAMHSKESQKKAHLSQVKKYGKLAMNLPENLEKMKQEAPKWRMINNIQRHIDYLKERDLEINAKNYIFAVWDTKRMWQQHVPNVLNKLDELRKLDGWTEEMESIFSRLSYDSTQKGTNKIIIN